MAIWYFGSPELPDSVKPIVDKVSDIGKHVLDISVGATRKSLELQAPITPVARFALEHGLNKLFDPKTETPTAATDELAQAQYGNHTPPQTDTIET